MMPLKQIETGARFGNLVCLGYSHTERNGSRWHAQCDCGSRLTVAGGALRLGRQRSCGCSRRYPGFPRPRAEAVAP